MKKIFLAWCLFLSVGAKAQPLYFPPVSGNTWDTLSPQSLGWCNTTINQFYNYLEQKNTKAFILLKDGKIVLEKYFGTFTADSLWYWASAGKTLTGAIVGIAQQENFLKLSDTSNKYLGPGWTQCAPAEERKITIWNHLTMTSGLDDGVPDNHCTLDSCLKCIAAPGTRWAYHNGPYTKLDGVIEGATGQSLNSYLTAKIKTPTGITGSFIKVDYDNVFFSKARSMARFGLLILNKGKWNTAPILTDTAYFNQMVNTSQNLNKSYGYLWWLNGKSSFMAPGLQTVFPVSLCPNAPADMIAAMGKNGQFINVVPSQNLVLVRMGNAPNSNEVPFTLNDTIWIKLNQLICSNPGAYISAGAASSMRVYPNPASETIYLASDRLPQRIDIVNALGRVVLTQVMVSSRTLSVAHLNNGLYHLKVFSEQGESAVVPLLIQH